MRGYAEVVASNNALSGGAGILQPMPMKPSRTFAASRYLSKVVDEEDIVGYAVWSARGGFKLMPIYAAGYRVRVDTGKRTVPHFLATYEIGDPLNAASAEDDPVAAHLALVATSAITALVNHRQLRRQRKRKRERLLDRRP